MYASHGPDPAKIPKYTHLLILVVPWRGCRPGVYMHQHLHLCNNRYPICETFLKWLESIYLTPKY